MEYTKVETGNSQLIRFDFKGEFDGQIIVDAETLETYGFYETSCFINTPHGRYGTVMQLNPEMLENEESEAIEILVHYCIRKYKREVARRYNPQTDAESV